MPVGIYRRGATVDERFWGYVTKTSTCWLWTGTQDGRGYGQIRVDHHLVRVHRWAYARLVGPIAVGMDIDHLCRVHNCVNPSHMEVVTRRVNVLRGISVSAQAALKVSCPQGHPYDEKNTYYRPKTSHRGCRTCNRQRQHLRAVAQALMAQGVELGNVATGVPNA